MHVRPPQYRSHRYIDTARPPVSFFAVGFFGRSAAAGLSLSLLLLAGCTAKPAAPPPEPPEVLVATVMQRDVPLYREWVAQLNGSVNAQISPKVTGYVIGREYKEGYYVKQGQTLFEIDPRPYRVALDQAKANVAQAIANLDNSKLNVARDTPLAKEKAIAQSQLDNDIQTMAANQASVDAAKAAQQTAELNLAWTRVESPIDGIAGIATAQVGDLVGTTSTLTNVSQVNPIRAYFSISERDYLSIASQVSQVVHASASSQVLGATKVQFIQANGKPYPENGKFVLVNRQVNSGTGTIQFASEFENKGSILRPGGFGTIRIQFGMQKNALLIPQKAVNEVQGEYQVVVLSNDNKAQFRTVEVGDRFGQNWIVLKGLQPGERVVAEGFQKLRNGMPVVPKPYTAPAITATTAVGAN